MREQLQARHSSVDPVFKQPKVSMDAHRASATASTKADATVGTRAMGTPGEMLDRWNFDYEVCGLTSLCKQLLSP